MITTVVPSFPVKIKKPKLTLTVRTPTLVDAVGAGMAHYIMMQENLAGQVIPEEYWEHHREEELIAYWHEQICKAGGGRLALASQGRRVVGMGLVTPAAANDHGLGHPARALELSYLGIMDEYFDSDSLQRLFDFVLGPTQPAQTWIYRNNQRLRRFLRMNGFTLDGLSVEDPETGLAISRMTR